ncbi:MAG: hypothetical protein HZB68_00175 [Candidatus Aenigmarchaeota archaeon]|nr:hypothetical protein [Candidatus Aenigmarchaeota archaeon]
MEYKTWLEKYTEKKTETSKIEELLEIQDKSKNKDVIVTGKVKEIRQMHNDYLSTFIILEDSGNCIIARGAASSWRQYELIFAEKDDEITVKGDYIPKDQQIYIYSAYNHSLEERMGTKKGDTRLSEAV